MTQEEIKSELISTLSVLIMLLDQDIREMKLKFGIEFELTAFEQEELKKRIIELTNELYPPQIGKLKGTAIRKDLFF